eukprot:TRINITY_DN291_c0_g1_i11.p1 TRINITY_DN291_c0_g1~~TRINITY_DN291_c0_g1_i11.p1  ORF type:complete len:373 (-),score=144.22 TRINITY_DN291_c0_g1_i11:79-1197(-)
MSVAQEDLGRTIVIDNGTGVCKAGFGGDELPQLTFKCVVGEPIVPNDDDRGKVFVGDEVMPLQGYLKVRYPLANGKVSRWDDMERIWDLTFEKLDVEPEFHPVLLTEAPYNPLVNREKMTEIMFEKYKVPGMYVAIQAVLSLYASGRTTGIVLDSGDGVTHTVPIYEGYSLPYAVERLNLAGRDVTNYLKRLLMGKGYNFSTSAEFEIVREIKERTAFVRSGSNVKPKINKALKATYEMPAGDEIEVDEERWQCAECLFDPSLVGMEAQGVPDLICQSIQKCPIDIRSELFKNIILSGGTTMFKGFRDRVEKEIKLSVNPATKVKVVSPPERKYSVWIGGSVLADLFSFKQMLISMDEYYEFGAGIVHRKCF